MWRGCRKTLRKKSARKGHPRLMVRQAHKGNKSNRPQSKKGLGGFVKRSGGGGGGGDWNHRQPSRRKESEGGSQLSAHSWVLSKVR